MKIIKQYFEWIPGFEPDGKKLLQLIELAGRVCYKSEDKITEHSAPERVRSWIDSGHHSVIEHANISVRIVTDRGVTHEIVRHRIASYSQESTRYCNYVQDKFGNEITVILPVWFYGGVHSYNRWEAAMQNAEHSYFALLYDGQTPQQARSVLPNSLKTELIMTCNVREWRHFFTLRTSPRAHPQMRALALDMLAGFKEKVPVIFDDIKGE